MKLLIRYCVFLLLLIVTVVALVWLWGYKTNLPAPNMRSANDFDAVLLSSHPELFTKNGQPVFTIIKTIKPQQNWYILKLTTRAIGGPSSFVVINDPSYSDEYMHVAIGPESKFSNQELSGVPNTTAKALHQEGAV